VAIIQPIKSSAPNARLHHAEKPVFNLGIKPRLNTESSVNALVLASSGSSSSSLLRNGLIVILIGLLLQIVGGFSGLLVWIGSIFVLVGLIMIIIYLINSL